MNLYGQPENSLTQEALESIISSHAKWLLGEPGGQRADLREANLTLANLRAANLRAANLSEANLREANLTLANLTPIRDDIYAVLSSAPAEVAGLLQALREGRVDGSQYQGRCACLVGTLANVRGCRHDAIPDLQPDCRRASERFFMLINEGDTPATSQASKLAEEWISGWLNRMQSAFQPKEQEVPA